MSKQIEFQIEFDKWQELFTATIPETQKAASGLIQKAAFLHSICWELEQTINMSGAIKIHPEHPEIQKQIPAVKEYARLTESYAAIVHKMNGMLNKGMADDNDDDMKDFE